MTITEQIEMTGIVPVVVIDDKKDAEPLAKALCDGGLYCAEITFRTDAAEEAIKKIVKAQPEMLVGAGTVLTVEQVDRAVDAGAKFIASPALNQKVVEYCQKRNVPIFPGVNSAGQIDAAICLNLDVVKFFPAEQSGGISMIKALSAPFPNLRFMPTGGINAENLNNYLLFDKVIACGGSWMVDRKLVSSGQFDKIRSLTESAVKKMHNFCVNRIGINCKDKTEAVKTSNLLKNIFGFEEFKRGTSIFASDEIEFIFEKHFGSCGQIAIGANSVERAKYALQIKGVQFDENSAFYDENKKLQKIYLVDEFCGLKICIVKNPQ